MPLNKENVLPPIRKRNPAVSVAALLQCTNLGGMEQVAYSLFEQLQDRGVEFQITSARTWGLGRSRIRNVDPGAVTFEYRGKFGWRSFPQFRRHALRVARDCQRVWVIGSCASCLVAARLSGKKTLFSHHYHHFENRTSRVQWTGFYLAFGAGLDAITYPTAFTRNEALKIAPWLEPKTHVVRNGFDVHYTTEEKRLEDRRKARAALQMPQDGLLIGAGGWLIPRKRFDVFLRTALAVSKRLPNARFYICGGGPEESRLRDLAQELGIADRVHFQGWVQDLTPYYQAWDALLFNSDFDALGNTPLEAASHGCVSVASVLNGGLSEFIQQGHSGFLLNQHDPEWLAQALIQLEVNPALALELRQGAVSILKEKFSQAAALDFYENYFRSNRL